MNMEQLNKEYAQRISNKKKNLQKLKKRIFGVSMARTLLFISICLSFYYLWQNKSLLSTTISLEALLFILFIKAHNKLFKQKKETELLIQINQRELEAINGDLKNFDKGDEFIDHTHFYSFDLDVFGENSLFQLINRTSTKIGKIKLANWLNNHLIKSEQILKRQESIKEITPLLQLRQSFQLIGLSNEEQLTELDLLQWIQPSKLKKERLLKITPYLVATINMLLLIFAILQITPISIGVIFFVFSIVLNTILVRQIKAKLEDNTKGLLTLSTYTSLFMLLEEHKFESELNKELIKSCYQKEKRPSRQLNKIINLSDNIKQRNNLFIALLFNGLFLWEFHLSLKIEQWKKEHITSLPKWIESLSQFDALISLANFAYNHPTYTYPNIVTEEYTLCGQDLGHPLMLKKECVTNPISMNSKGTFLIITGANMAGKSTYLRTIGLNYLLACIGTTVYAKKFNISPSQLITSLRTSDSLMENESYFFAELKRLKVIIDLLNKGNNLFIILDEILKGTNSIDKLKGSTALIEQLIHKETNGLIATHDIQLTELEHRYPKKITNFCFESTINNGEINFDYQLKQGVVKNMNAYFLMRKMGILNKR